MQTSARLTLEILEHLDYPEKLNLRIENWNEIIKFSQKQRLIIPLAYTIKSSPLWSNLPAEIQSLLTSALYLGAHQWEKISETKKALKTLLPHHRFLKGSKTAEILYPTPILRTMNDIDILVPKNEFHNALTHLQRNGFELTEDATRTSTLAHEAGLLCEKTKIYVELHHSLFIDGRYCFITDDFFNSENSNELELLYLCAHAITHFSAEGSSHGLCYFEILRFHQQIPTNIDIITKLGLKTNSLLAYGFALSILGQWWPKSFQKINGHDRLDCLNSKMNLRQKTNLKLMQKIYLDNFNIHANDFSKKALQALVADDLWQMLKFTLSWKRIALTGKFQGKSE